MLYAWKAGLCHTSHTQGLDGGDRRGARGERVGRGRLIAGKADGMFGRGERRCQAGLESVRGSGLGGDVAVKVPGPNGAEEEGQM